MLEPDNRPRIKVLVVEDDPNDFELLQKTLACELPCQVKVALTENAFRTGLQGAPDIIVSDSNVLAFDGMMALKIAREECPEIPFVFCSGNRSPEKQKRALAAGADGWASKDDGFSQLVQAVKRLCANKLKRH